jgi:DNA-binding response OmpR family regulator
MVGSEPVDVTPKEFELLILLTGHPGRPFSREELLDRIWKDDLEVTDRTIDTHVQRLRKKLGPWAEAIQTVWGIGYRYQP